MNITLSTLSRHFTVRNESHFDITRVIALLMLFLFSYSDNGLWGQKSYRLYTGDLSDTTETYLDTLNFCTAIEKKLAYLRSKQYITSSLDSVRTKDSVTTAYIFKGSTYKYGTIETTKNYRQLINLSGLKNYKWKEKIISPNQIESYSEKILLFLENHGYPFATVGLDSIQIKNQTVNAHININKGPLTTWDSLNIKGKTIISEQFLRKYLMIKKGDPFNRKRYENVSKRINELPFMKLTQQPKLKFIENKAQLTLQTIPIKSNRFDFIIGVLPADVNGKKEYTISGNFTAELNNKLGYGEYIFANFERLKPEVQELDLKFKLPYVAGLPIGVITDLTVYRRSGDFLEVKSKIGLDYQLSGNLNLSFGWDFKSSRLIEIDTTTIKEQKKLPTNLDVTHKGGQVEISYQNLDYKYNPTSGWDIQVGTTLGEKSILPNNAILQIGGSNSEFAAAYDTLKLKTLQAQADLNIANYFPLAKLITLKSRIRAGLIYNEENVFENEFYRLGGNKLLRGFNEQSVLAKSYTIATTELRLLLDQNSYLTLPFIDFGYTLVNTRNQPIWEQVIGVGIGINFSTTAGLFNVSFASGGINSNIDFGNTKVHFGYVSLF